MPRQVSTITGIIIIVAVAVIAVGGVFVYEYGLLQNANIKLQNENIKTKTPVTENPVKDTNGVLKGKATINQPVTQSCPKPVGNEKFGIKIYQNTALVKTLKFNPDGTFNVNLSAGIYMVYPDYYQPGTVTTPDMWSRVLPKQVAITAGQTAQLNISTAFYCNAQ